LSLRNLSVKTITNYWKYPKQQLMTKSRKPIRSKLLNGIQINTTTMMRRVKSMQIRCSRISVRAMKSYQIQEREINMTRVLIARK